LGAYFGQKTLLIWEGPSLHNEGGPVKRVRKESVRHEGVLTRQSRLRSKKTTTTEERRKEMGRIVRKVLAGRGKIRFKR